MPTPDVGALYLKHRDAMYRVAASILREAGIADQAGDAVQEAIESLISSPPTYHVDNWEAYLVTIAKRRAYDRLRSAAVRHAGPQLAQEHDRADEIYVDDDVADTIDALRAGAEVWDALGVLDARARRVVTGIAQEISRDALAEELGVTPPRISQIYRKALEQLREAVTREEETNP